MSSITSFGSLAGLNLTQLLGKMEDSASGRLDAMRSQAQSYSSQLSGYGKIRGALTSFQSAADALGADKLFTISEDTGKPNPDALSAVKAFVDAYNAVQDTVSAQTTFDPATQSPGALAGNAALRSIQGGMRSTLDAFQTGGPDGASGLEAVGLSFDKDGKLTLDADKFNAAMTRNPEAVGKLFAGDDGKPGISGAMSDLASQYNGDKGALASASQEVSDALNQLGGRYDDETTRVQGLMATYRAQYTQLDLLFNKMGTANAFLSQQMLGLQG